MCSIFLSMFVVCVLINAVVLVWTIIAVYISAAVHGMDKWVLVFALVLIGVNALGIFLVTIPLSNHHTECVVLTYKAGNET